MIFWGAFSGAFTGAMLGIVATFLGLYWSDRITRARKNRPQEPTSHE